MGYGINPIYRGGGSGGTVDNGGPGGQGQGAAGNPLNMQQPPPISPGISEDHGGSYDVANLDPETQAFLDQTVSRLQAPSQQIADSYLSGTGSARGLMNSNQPAALGPMSEAIQGRANRYFDQDYGQIKKLTEGAANRQYLNNLKIAQDLQTAPRKVQIGAYQMAVQAQMEAQAQRSKILGSLFSGIGTVSGMAYGSSADSSKAPTQTNVGGAVAISPMDPAMVGGLGSTDTNAGYGNSGGRMAT